MCLIKQHNRMTALAWGGNGQGCIKIVCALVQMQVPAGIQSVTTGALEAAQIAFVGP